MGERARYRITFARPARADMEALDPPIGRRVLAKIESLAHGPRPAGCLKLQGATNLWRVLYTIDDAAGVVDVAAIRHRSDAYR